MGRKPKSEAVDLSEQEEKRLEAEPDFGPDDPEDAPEAKPKAAAKPEPVSADLPTVEVPPPVPVARGRRIAVVYFPSEIPGALDRYAVGDARDYPTKADGRVESAMVESIQFSRDQCVVVKMRSLTNGQVCERIRHISSCEVVYEHPAPKEQARWAEVHSALRDREKKTTEEYQRGF